MSFARLVLPWFALSTGLAPTGCALAHLDLDGGAHVTAVQLDDAGLTLAVDDTRPLVLTLVYDDGFEEAAPGAGVTWEVDDPQIASIDGDQKLRGRGVGTAMLTGRYGDRSAAVAITVTDAPQQLEILTASRTCAVGQQLAYKLVLHYQHGSTEDATARASWTSDQATIVSVTAGVVTALAIGDTRVEAALGALTTSADVHVSAAVAVRVDVAPAVLQLAVGAAQKFTASARYSDGNTLDVTRTAQWQSSLATVASVAPDGTVTAVAAGKVTITATRDGTAGTAALTVVAAP
jgi:uncharacterized protein YjdB